MSSDTIQTKCESSVIPAKTSIVLKHERQQFDWDCGLACLLMVLPQKSRLLFKNTLENVWNNSESRKSIWTIDLCYILKHYNIKHDFYTKTLGFDRCYLTTSPFYANISDAELLRVAQKFADAHKNDIRLFCSQITMETILQHLNYGPIIVLTNSELLECTFCRFNHQRTINEPNNSYEGHFIVLCGYDMLEKCICYRNPACFDHICYMKFEKFELARKSCGTDEDIILIDYN